MNKTLITFASEGYERSAEALMRSAAPYFDNLRIYTPEDIKDFMAEHPAHFENSKGFGWWAWKPYIILDAMKKTRTGDVVMYTDACMEFVRSAEDILNPVFPINIYSSGQFHHQYCKTYTFNAMEVKRLGLQEQANGAYQVYKHSGQSEVFLQFYLQWCTDLPCINDELLIEIPDFNSHRHDQAILTNLCIKNGIPIRPDIVSQYGTSNPIINHHRRRL